MKFGGWMTVTNLVSPIMVYMDRFLIGSLLSIGAVAYYTAPFDMVTRLLLVPGGIAGVLFPAVAVSLAQGSKRTGLLLARGEKYIFLAVFPAVLVIVTLAPEALRLWLDLLLPNTGLSHSGGWLLACSLTALLKCRTCSFRALAARILLPRFSFAIGDLSLLWFGS